MKDTITIIHHNPKKDTKKQYSENPNALIKTPKSKIKPQKSVKQLWVSLNHALQWPQLKERLQAPALLAAAKKNWLGLTACTLFLLFLFRTPDIQQTIGAKVPKNQEASIIPLEKSGAKDNAKTSQLSTPPIAAAAKENPVQAGEEEEETMQTIPQIPQATRSDRSVLKELGNHAQSLRDEYISRFVAIAKTEQHKFGIPASVTLALAILNSEFGTTVVAKEGNNHLHITCDENPVPMGKGMSGQGIHGGICYTRYESNWMGFRAHSEMIQRKYKNIADKAGNNYEKWVKMLDKAGYFKESVFSSSALIKTIELYQLDQFDQS